MSGLLIRTCLLAALINFIIVNNISAHKKPTSQWDLPEVASRTYAENYKDLALAVCIAKAYKNEPKASADAAATAAGLESTWTNYDLEKGSGEISKLVDRYLTRNYPSIQGKEIKLDLLKCLDLYHSKALNRQVKQFVLTPNRSYKQDYTDE